MSGPELPRSWMKGVELQPQNPLGSPPAERGRRRFFNMTARNIVFGVGAGAIGGFVTLEVLSRATNILSNAVYPSFNMVSPDMFQPLAIGGACIGAVLGSLYGASWDCPTRKDN